MEPYQERVINEAVDLNEKIDKLEVYICSESFDKIDRENQGLLKVQSDCMWAYQSVLLRRIEVMGLKDEYESRINS